MLTRYCGHTSGFDVRERIAIMTHTIAGEHNLAKLNSQEDPFAVFQGRNLVRFFIASWPKVNQQFVRLSVFNTYSTYFFQAAGNKNPFLVTVILSAVQLLSMVMTFSLADKLGRRPLTVYPYAVTSASLLSLGVVGCFDSTQASLSMLLVFFAALATFSTTGASAIGYAYASEIPQQRVRARTAAWALAFSNLVAILFNFCTPLMINGTVKWGVRTAFFFACSGTIAVILAWFILPEVTRRTPGEIDEMFEKKINLRKFDKFVTDAQIRVNEQSIEKKGHSVA